MSPRARIASLVPSATEILFELGLGERVVAVTHECDHPAEATARTSITRSVIPEGLSSAEIDRAVRERTERGEAIYALDEEALASLAPDLIVTQALCAVCAVSFDDVRAVAARIASHPEVISLDPTTLTEVLDDVETVASAAGDPDAGARLRESLGQRLAAVRAAVAGASRPRVLALEWLDPPFIGGHWVPEMIAIAGGTDALGRPGERSTTMEWNQLADTGPELVVVMPCGLYADEAAAEASRSRDRLGALGAGRVIAVDAASSFSRPGPRLIDGIELLAHLLHPERVPAPAAPIAWRELDRFGVAAGG